jgi:hypothetical protein
MQHDFQIPHIRARTSYSDLVPGGTQRFNNRSEIRQLLEPARTYCRSIGLSLDTAILNPINNNYNNTSVALHINELNLVSHLDLRTKAFKALIGKDEGNLSDKSYIKMRNHVNFANLPTIDEIVDIRKEIDQKLYEIKQNDFGYYNDPIQKITKICSKFYEEQKTVKDDVFIIKLGGDGTNLTKSNTTALNLAFTVINDFEKVKSVIGNYSIGKIFHYFYVRVGLVKYLYYLYLL